MPFPENGPVSTVQCADLEFWLFQILLAEDQLWVKAVMRPEETGRH